MPIATIPSLLSAARDAGRGLLAVNVIQVEHAEAFVAAAKAANCPVVLQISENAAKYHGGSPPSAWPPSRSRAPPPRM